MLEVRGKSLGLALVAASVFGIATPAAASQTTLQNTLAAGSTLTVRTIAGFVHVSHGAQTAVVRAVARPTSDGHINMHVAQTRSGSNWTVCEVPIERTSCDGGNDEDSHGEKSSVDLTISVPPGVKLDVATVSGDIEITGVTSGVDAKSVSGRVKIATAGSASAKTVSGDLDVRVGAVANSASFDSVSGRIALALPRSTNAKVVAQTLSGSVTGGSGVNFSGDRNFIGHDLHATLGRGGSAIDIHTVSGSIAVKTF